MRTSLIFAAFTAMLTSMPLAAQTMPLVIQNAYADRAVVSAPLSLAQRIEVAAEGACERPSVRNLKGWELYAECLTEVRTEIETQLAENDQAVIELALR